MWTDARAYRPLIMGRRGAVAANHPLAAQAGLLTLQAGGAAADAAVAMAMTLGVVEPFMSGLGGDGFYHHYDRATGKAQVFNGTGPAPGQATPERYAGGIPKTGPLSVSVPGTVAALALLHARHGRLAWSQLFEAAIHYADAGFGVSHAFRHYTGSNLAVVAADRRGGATFLADGVLPALGHVVRQPDLAQTLTMLGDEGAEGFYRGGLAKRFAQGCTEAGTLVTAADLAAFEAEIQTPIEIAYRGFTVRQAPPNSMGWVLLQELKIAEWFDLKAMGHGSADLVHMLVEIKKLAFADRERHSADPRHFTAPLERLLSADYAAELACRIDPSRAIRRAEPALALAGDTTYFAVIDGAGNAVSGIQSLNSTYGSGAIAGDTGILLNNRMSPWHLEPGHPNRLVPGKRVRHTMNPPMVFKDGELWCVFGTPGGDNQVQVNFQALTMLIDFGLDPQAAAEAPRWSSSEPGQEANWPHTAPDALQAESRFGQDVLDDLRRRGHAVAEIGALDGPCSIEIIRRDAASGMLLAGSDPRRDGWALAY